jgi:zinc transporter 2
VNNDPEALPRVLQKTSAQSANVVEPSKSDDGSRLKRACIYVTLFMLVEIVLGFLSGSIAIFTDAAHMLSDLSGFLISLVALRLSRREATRRYSYGYHQVEVLGAMLSVFLVWFLTGGLLLRAYDRFRAVEDVNAELMLATAIFGLITNVLLMVTLGHNHGPGHGQGCSHGCSGHGRNSVGGEVNVPSEVSPLPDEKVSSEPAPDPREMSSEPRRSLLLDAAYVHALGDLLQNVGVLVAAALIYFQPGDVGETDGISNWMYADPGCTIVFSVLVIWSTKSPFVRAVRTVMHECPEYIDVEEYERRLLTVRHVTAIHDLHVWAVGSNGVLSTAHLEIDATRYSTEVLEACIRISNSLGIYHTTFQLDVKGFAHHKLETFGGIHGHERCCAPKRRASEVDDQGVADEDADEREQEQGQEQERDLERAQPRARACEDEHGLFEGCCDKDHGQGIRSFCSDFSRNYRGTRYLSDLRPSRAAPRRSGTITYKSLT